MPRINTRSPAHVALTASLSQVECFPCSSCDKIYRRRGDLNRHTRSHDTSTWAQCPFCDHRTSQKSNLDGHINKKHTFAKPHKCRSCPEQFADKSDRAKHQRRAHPELADVNSHVGLASRTKKQSIATAVPAASTLQDMEHFRTPEDHLQNVSWDSSSDSDASITPSTATPTDVLQSYKSFFANDVPQIFLGALACYQSPLMPLDGMYAAAYPNTAPVAAGYPGSPLDTRMSDGLFVSDADRSCSELYGQQYPLIPCTHPTSQTFSGCYADLDWVPINL